MRLLKTVVGVNILALGLMAGACTSSPPQQPLFNKPNDPEAIKKAMQLSSPVTRQDGIAAAILLDTTGSMKEEILGVDKKPKSKLQVAQKALLNLMRQFAEFARKNPDKKLLVGIYEFSSRPNQPSCRQIVPLGPPVLDSAHSALSGIIAEGATPIGDAMIAAKRDLDATGLSHRHILVITDGDSNRGYLPGDVARVIASEPEADRAAIYFIAFDVGAEYFDPVKEAGGLILAAEGEQQLTDTLDYILTGKILVEQPGSPSMPHPSMGIKK